MDNATQQRVTNQNPQGQSSYRKRKWLKWGLLYLAVALAVPVIAFGIFYASFILEHVLSPSPYSPPLPARVTQPTPTPTDESANPDLIGANWKTYTGEFASLKFEIKYPDNWDYSAVNAGELQVSFYPYHPSSISSRDKNDPLGPILLYASLSDGLKCLAEPPESSCTDLVVDGVLGKRYQRRADHEIVAFQKDNVLLHLIAPKFNQDSFYQGHYPREYYSFYNLPAVERTKIFDAMLSTFRFTNQAPMDAMSSTEPCDLNSDGRCNETDFTLFKKALGKKRGDLNYNPLADADADGVVTDVDAQILQFPFPITLPKSTPTPNSNQVLCTQDVKQCPDGSYVGRRPPRCEFAQCP